MSNIKKPMLAVACKDLTTLNYPLLATPKLDGIRCLVVNGVAVSRKFKPIPNLYIRNWIEANCPNGFDGEIMLANPHANFNEVQSAVMSEDGEPDFYYWVFDYVSNDLTQAYAQRIQALRDWMTKNTNHTKLVFLLPQVLFNNDSLQQYETQKVVLDGYEGVMVRSPEGPYKCGRSTLKEGYLLKIKRFEDSEAEVLALEEKMHNNNEATKDELGHTKRSSHMENLVPANTLGTLVVKDLKTGVEFRIGTGLDDEMRQKIWNHQSKYIGAVVTYTFQPSGMLDKPRFPSFKGFRHTDDM